MAIAAGLLTGLYQIQNTSIGWHLAAGRWMLEHVAILRTNPFTYTALGHPWLDHEWMFQLLAASVSRISGPFGLVLMRMLFVAAVAAVLYRHSRNGELPSVASLFLTVLCLLAARWRFYLRPELFTLVLLPLGLGFFLRRNNFPLKLLAPAMVLIMALGINSHAGILLLPLLAATAAAAEHLQGLVQGEFKAPAFYRDVFLIGLTSLAALLNPWTWKAVWAPFRLAHLVAQPWVANPEWLRPTLHRFPELYLAIIAGLILLVVSRAEWSRKLLFLVLSGLALRYVRNEGIFFVLFPLLMAPSLQVVSRKSLISLDSAARRRLGFLLAAGAMLLCVIAVNARGFPLGLGFSQSTYPVGACRYLERSTLLEMPIYNDVRFGGWLIGQYFPAHRFFIDDRNEVHEELLRRIWTIQSSSSVRRWQEMLDSFRVKTALLRYHKPIEVQTPEGKAMGRRGYSALWFPSSRWALVYWDDNAMVLLDRTKTDPEWLASQEYHELRPDDGEYLLKRLKRERALRPEIKLELSRRLQEDPQCRRALELAAKLLP